MFNIRTFLYFSTHSHAHRGHKHTVWCWCVFNGMRVFFRRKGKPSYHSMIRRALYSDLAVRCQCMRGACSIHTILYIFALSKPSNRLTNLNAYDFMILLYHSVRIVEQWSTQTHRSQTYTRRFLPYSVDVDVCLLSYGNDGYTNSHTQTHRWVWHS